MQNLNVQANALGSAPVYAQVVGVEGHAAGVDMRVPRTEGTLSKKSAIDLAHALLTAAGGEVGASAPTSFDKWTLKGDAANGFSLVNPLGVEQKFFAPVSAVVHYA